MHGTTSKVDLDVPVHWAKEFLKEFLQPVAVFFIPSWSLVKTQRISLPKEKLLNKSLPVPFSRTTRKMRRRKMNEEQQEAS